MKTLLCAVVMAVVPPASGLMPLLNKNHNRNRRLSKGSKTHSKGSKNAALKALKAAEMTITSSAVQEENSAPYNDPASVLLPPGSSKSSKAASKAVDHDYWDGLSKSSKASAKSSKSSSGAKSIKSGKAFYKSAKSAKVIAYVNVITDTTHLIQITNAPTPQPAKSETEKSDIMQLQSTIIESESTKIYTEMHSQYWCTGDPCPIDTHCRTQHWGCGTGRLYCNEYTIWTQLCPTSAPTATPPATAAESSSFGFLSVAEVLDGTTAATSSLSVEDALVTESSSNFMSGMKPSDSYFPIEDEITPMTTLGEDKIPLETTHTGNVGGSPKKSGFPIVGYVGIALILALLLGIVIIPIGNRLWLKHKCDELQQDDGPLESLTRDEDAGVLYEEDQGELQC